MSKFNFKRKFPLEFLGDDWKESYIELQQLTVSDIKNKFPTLANINEKNPKEVTEGLDAIIAILTEKFISGKGIDSEGKSIDITVEDLKDFPIEALSRALGFLSQGVTPPLQKPSEA